MQTTIRHTHTIPKEYMLERPAFYDEHKFKKYMDAVLRLKGFRKIYENGSELLLSFFDKNPDHKEIALDILRYVMDKNITKENLEIKKMFVAGLYEGGFFG